MQYKKKIMRASEIEQEYGYAKSSISRLIHLPGQTFAFKLHPERRNSPVLIDTERLSGGDRGILVKTHGAEEVKEIEKQSN